MNIASYLRKYAAAGVCAGFALVCAADTLEVPKDETVQLASGTDYSGTTVAMSGGTLDQNGVTATLAGMTLSSGTVNRLVNSGGGGRLCVADHRGKSGVELRRGALCRWRQLGSVRLYLVHRPLGE